MSKVGVDRRQQKTDQDLVGQEAQSIRFFLYKARQYIFGERKFPRERVAAEEYYSRCEHGQRLTETARKLERGCAD